MKKVFLSFTVSVFLILLLVFAVPFQAFASAEFNDYFDDIKSHTEILALANVIFITDSAIDIEIEFLYPQSRIKNVETVRIDPLMGSFLQEGASYIFALNKKGNFYSGDVLEISGHAVEDLHLKNVDFEKYESAMLEFFLRSGGKVSDFFWDKNSLFARVDGDVVKVYPKWTHVFFIELIFFAVLFSVLSFFGFFRKRKREKG